MRKVHYDLKILNNKGISWNHKKIIEIRADDHGENMKLKNSEWVLCKRIFKSIL